MYRPTAAPRTSSRKSTRGDGCSCCPSSASRCFRSTHNHHPLQQQLLERLKDYGEEDVISLWDELFHSQRHLLIHDIESLDLPRVDRIILRCSLESQGLPTAAIEPIPGNDVSTVEGKTMEERERWWKMGLKAISEGKLAVLLLSGGQVCLHMFTLDFLNQVANDLEKDSIFYLAEKKIPSIHGPTVGLKLEQFIFDSFPYAPSTGLFEVLRDEEFAPVKNANGSNFDTPDSARLLVLRLHSRWVVDAGGFVTHSVPLYATGVEVSPLCSYAGENLKA